MYFPTCSAYTIASTEKVCRGKKIIIIIPQAFSQVLRLLLQNISDSKKVGVMIRLLNVIREKLNKENY